MLSGPVKVSFSALMTSKPSSTWALTVRLVYVSSSLLPQPLPPRSKDHLLESTAESAGPANSSLHTRLHTAGLLACVGGQASKNETRTQANKRVNRAALIVLAVNRLLLE